MQKRKDALKYSPRLLHLAPALLFTIVAASSHAGSSAVRDADASRISVTAVAGAVDFTMAGKAVTVTPNATVLLPAHIVTGHDGTVGLTQARTKVSVASETDVEIPAEAVDGNLIARMVQHRGNVFYDVAPRDLGKLRVETPFLVAVIKGTQFNVAVQDDSTTISLFEGTLEIRTPDNDDIVQLNAGEIAIRSLIDDQIRIVGMDDERAAVPRPARADVAAEAAPAEPRETVVEGVAVAGDTVVDKPTTSVRDTGVAAKPVIEAAAADIAVRAPVTLDAAVEPVSATAFVDVKADPSRLDVALDTGVAVGSAAVDVNLDAAVDLGGAALDVALDTKTDLGGAVDLGVATRLDVVDTGLDLGGVVDTGVALDTGTLDLGLDTTLDLGGALDVGLDVGLGGGALDLGLGSDATTTTSETPAPPPPPPRGLLGGLLP